MCLASSAQLGQSADKAWRHPCPKSEKNFEDLIGWVYQQFTSNISNNSMQQGILDQVIPVD